MAFHSQVEPSLICHICACACMSLERNCKFCIQSFVADYVNLHYCSTFLFSDLSLACHLCACMSLEINCFNREVVHAVVADYVDLHYCSTFYILIFNSIFLLFDLLSIIEMSRSINKNICQEVERTKKIIIASDSLLD